MRMAITTRTGENNKPLTLWIQKVAWEDMPAIGTAVCAYGAGGWQYYGTVTATNPSNGSYIIGNVVAANKIMDNLRQWGGH